MPRPPDGALRRGPPGLAGHGRRPRPRPLRDEQGALGRGALRGARGAGVLPGERPRHRRPPRLPLRRPPDAPRARHRAEHRGPRPRAGLRGGDGARGAPGRALLPHVRPRRGRRAGGGVELGGVARRRPPPARQPRLRPRPQRAADHRGHGVGLRPGAARRQAARVRLRGEGGWRPRPRGAAGRLRRGPLRARAAERGPRPHREGPGRELHRERRALAPPGAEAGGARARDGGARGRGAAPRGRAGGTPGAVTAAAGRRDGRARPPDGPAEPGRLLGDAPRAGARRPVGRGRDQRLARLRQALALRRGAPRADRGGRHRRADAGGRRGRPRLRRDGSPSPSRPPAS